MDKIYVTKHAQLGIEWSGITIRRPKAGSPIEVYSTTETEHAREIIKSYRRIQRNESKTVNGMKFFKIYGSCITTFVRHVAWGEYREQGHTEIFNTEEERHHLQSEVFRRWAKRQIEKRKAAAGKKK